MSQVSRYKPIIVAFVRFVTVALNVQENMGIIYLVKIFPLVSLSRNACQTWLVLNLDWNKNLEQSHSLWWSSAYWKEKRDHKLRSFKVTFQFFAILTLKLQMSHNVQYLKHKCYFEIWDVTYKYSVRKTT